jgi:hypothetical protein
MIGADRSCKDSPTAAEHLTKQKGRNMEKQRPCYEQRVGNIRVVIWDNVSEGTANGNATPRHWFNVALTRRYKVGTEWKEAPTLNGLGDIAQAALALRLAEQWIAQRQELMPSCEDVAE